jgi:hypothetical protein
MSGVASGYYYYYSPTPSHNRKESNLESYLTIINP